VSFNAAKLQHTLRRCKNVSEKIKLLKKGNLMVKETKQSPGESLCNILSSFAMSLMVISETSST